LNGIKSLKSPEEENLVLFVVVSISFLDVSKKVGID
jgi:hypothetical protein